MRTLLLAAIAIVNLHYAMAQVTNKVILDKMYSSIKSIETLRFKLKKSERIKGELKYGEQDVKFQRQPKKVYTYIHKPNEGVELLWIEGQNNNHAYINPNGFPYINVNLHPYGSNMRKGNHHTVYEVGFDYIGNIVSHISKSCVNNFDEIFLLQGSVNFDSKDCYKIVIDYKPFKYIDYTVASGETVVDIAYKNRVSDFMILEKNPEIKSYDDVKAGQKIIIPNAYAKKTILYIDKKTYLPLVQMMHDEKGLYEQYEFYNLQVNPKIAEAEFTREYKDYHF